MDTSSDQNTEPQAEKGGSDRLAERIFARVGFVVVDFILAASRRDLEDRVSWPEDTAPKATE